MSRRCKLFRKSGAKLRINEFFSYVLQHSDGRFAYARKTPPVLGIYIDADNAMTTRAAVRTAGSGTTLHVMNYDDKVIAHAVETGRSVDCTVVGHVGVSTESMLRMRDEIGEDVVDGGYMDYCGSPDGNVKYGFDPKVDLKCLQSMLKEKTGVGLLTFCRRTKGGSALEKARAIIAAAGLVMLYEHPYRETSNMVIYLVSKPTMDQRTRRRWIRAFREEVVRHI
jgi:hypothetical protein